MARTTYVPLVSIMVVRPVDATKPDGETKQVDALAEYKATGKAFKFTADELKEIDAAFGGQREMALRDPSDEAADDEAEVPPPVASNEQPRTARRAAATAGGKDDDL